MAYIAGINGSFRVLLLSLLITLFFMAAVIQIAACTATDQYITLSKTAVPITGACNNYNVTLGVTGGSPPSKPMDVILVIDTSSSMELGSSPTSLDYAKSAAKTFVDKVLPTQGTSNNVGLVVYGTSATIKQSLTNNPTTIKNTINSLSISGIQYTNIKDGFDKAVSVLGTSSGCNRVRAIVLLSDGVANKATGCSNCPDWPTSADCCTNAAVQAGVTAQSTATVFTVGLFGYIHSSYRSSESIAASTLNQAQNGGYYQTYSGADLSDIYTKIAQRIQYAASAAVVTDSVSSSFDIIPDTISATSGTFETAGNTITWNIGNVGTQDTVKLRYNVSAKAGSCGTKAVNVPDATITYTKTDCTSNTMTFPSPSVVLTCLTPCTVTLSPPFILLGSSIKLTASSSGCSGSFTYKWYRNSISAQNEITNGGKYTISANTLTINPFSQTDAGNYLVVAACSGTDCQSVGTVTLTPVALLQYSIIGPDVVCQLDSESYSTDLAPNPGSGNSYSYVWHLLKLPAVDQKVSGTSTNGIPDFVLSSPAGIGTFTLWLNVTKLSGSIPIAIGNVSKSITVVPKPTISVVT